MMRKLQGARRVPRYRVVTGSIQIPTETGKETGPIQVQIQTHGHARHKMRALALV
jgi:hypothetical protein